MNPPCSSDDERNTSVSKTKTKTPHPNLLLLPFASPSFSFNRTTATFFKQQQQFLMETSKVVGQVQKSILEYVDKCVTMLHDFSSGNVVLDKIISFSSHIESLCQIPNRHRQNLVRLSNANFAAIIPGDSVAGLVATNGISKFLNIYNTLLVCRLVLTWFPNAPPVVVTPLSTLCDPYLNIFRGIIPPLGGTLDLSPILAFLVLNAFTSAASALPAELPSTELSKDNPFHSTSSSQKKWMTRLAGSENNSKRSNSEI